MSWRIGATCVAIKWKVLRVDKKLKGELTPFLKYPSKKLSERFKASEVVFKRRNGDHPFRILGLYGAGRNIEVSCVQSKHNLSTTSLAHINSTTCYNVQVRGKYLRLIFVWSGFPDNNLFFSLLFVPLCISWPRFFVTSNEVLLYSRCTAPYMRETDDRDDCFEYCKGRNRIVQWVLKLSIYISIYNIILYYSY